MTHSIGLFSKVASMMMATLGALLVYTGLVNFGLEKTTEPTWIFIALGLVFILTTGLIGKGNRYAYVVGLLYFLFLLLYIFVYVVVPGRMLDVVYLLIPIIPIALLLSDYRVFFKKN